MRTRTPKSDSTNHQCCTDVRSSHRARTGLEPGRLTHGLPCHLLVIHNECRSIHLQNHATEPELESEPQASAHTCSTLRADRRAACAKDKRARGEVGGNSIAHLNATTTRSQQGSAASPLPVEILRRLRSAAKMGAGSAHRHRKQCGHLMGVHGEGVTPISRAQSKVLRWALHRSRASQRSRTAFCCIFNRFH